MKYTIGQLAEIIDGDRGKNYPQQHEFLEDGYCLFLNTGNVTATGFSFESNQYISKEKCDLLRKGKLQRRDIVYTTRGTVGNAAFYADSVPYEHIRINSGMVIIRPNEDVVCTEFLYQILKSDYYRPYFKKYCTGSAQPQLPIKNFSTIELDLPDLETQQKISDMLFAYDDLIENNQKQIKLLEEAAQRLYREWFVDLRFPGHETTPIIDGIPRGWEDKVIEDLCDSIGGGTPSTKNDEYYRDGQIKWVTPTDITRKNGLILLDTEKKITEEGLQHSSAKMVPPYTILMTSRASVGFFGLCEYEVCTNQGFISCIPYQENTRYYLLYNLMNRVDEIRAKASGSTFLEISKKNFRGLRIVLPTDSVLDAFTKLIFPMARQMETLTKSIATLQEARDRLLPKLMNGAIEV